MANVKISPILNNAQFTHNGELLAGGKIYSFAANSLTSQKATYTDSSANTYNSNPIVLDSSGRLQSSIWLIENEKYQFVVTDSSNVTIETHNEVIGEPTPPANNYYISSVFNDNIFYNNDGNVLSYGKIYSYMNNSYSVKQPTYTSSSGETVSTNPIVLTSIGTLPHNIYLDTNKKYNLVLTKNDGTTILKNYNGSYGKLTETPTYFTSGIYPFLTEDRLNINVLTPTVGQLWQIAPDDMSTTMDVYSANLIVTINYVNYTNGVDEKLSVGLSAIVGNLTTVANYVYYNNYQDEKLSTSLSAVSGTLPVVINVVNYNNYQDEKLSTGLTVISGTLI